MSLRPIGGPSLTGDRTASTGLPGTVKRRALCRGRTGTAPRKRPPGPGLASWPPPSARRASWPPRASPRRTPPMEANRSCPSTSQKTTKTAEAPTTTQRKVCELLCLVGRSSWVISRSVYPRAYVGASPANLIPAIGRGHYYGEGWTLTFQFLRDSLSGPHMATPSPSCRIRYSPPSVDGVGLRLCRFPEVKLDTRVRRAGRGPGIRADIHRGLRWGKGPPGAITRR